MMQYQYTKKQQAAIKDWEQHTGFEMMYKGEFSFSAIWVMNNDWLRDWAAEADAIANRNVLHDDRTS